MGFLAKCLAFAAPWLKFDRGLGGDVRTGRLALPPGIAAVPVPGDTLLVIQVPGTGGRFSPVAVVAAPGPTVDAGEVALYSRAGSTVQAVIHAKADGSVSIQNPAGGEFSMAENGEVTINGTLFKPGGVVEAASAKVGGVQVVGHVHQVIAEGSPSGPMEAGV